MKSWGIVTFLKENYLLHLFHFFHLFAQSFFSFFEKELLLFYFFDELEEEGKRHQQLRSKKTPIGTCDCNLP